MRETNGPDAPSEPVSASVRTVIQMSGVVSVPAPVSTRK